MLAAWKPCIASSDSPCMNTIHLYTHYQSILCTVQHVHFNEATAAQVARDGPPKTTLTEFVQLCEHDDFAKTLIYSEVPQYYAWVQKKWCRRKRGSKVQGHPGVFRARYIGHVYTASPKQMECYFLRLLLHHISGPTSFADLRVANGVCCTNYRAACLALGLVEDDNHLHSAITEAANCHRVNGF